MSQTKKADLKTKPEPLHRILREVFRHYLEFRDLVSAQGGDGVIEHGYWIWPEGEGGPKKRVMVTISFWDLMYGLRELSPRKREAVWFNVIQDMLQREVAEIMGITTVSVGQYVEQAMIQLSERYFAGEDNGEQYTIYSKSVGNGGSHKPVIV